SKAITALCLGRPILFFGSAESDAWGWAAGGGWLVEEKPDGGWDAAAQAAALAEIGDPAALARRTALAQQAGEALRQAEAAGVAALAGWLARG
ncbi:MAG: hypothetical protein ACK40R_08995, partial [Thermomonas sp.]